MRHWPPSVSYPDGAIPLHLGGGVGRAVSLEPSLLLLRDMGDGVGYREQGQNDKKCIYMRFSLHHTNFCRLLVSRSNLRRLYEHGRLQFLVSHADEPDNFWR